MENTITNQKIKSSDASFAELYAKKDFKNAVDYLLHNKQQFSSGTFHYNLGTTYAKLGDIGAARFHLEKAREAGVYHSAMINNLRFVESKIDAEDLSTSTSFADQVIDYSLKVPTSGYLTISLFLLIITTLIFIKNKQMNSLKSWCMLVVCLTPIMYSQFYLQSLNQAVSLKEITVYEGPSKIFLEKGKIKPGAKVLLGEFKDGWFFIKYPISLSGWVNKDNLGIL
jgi:hypothetical protein